MDPYKMIDLPVQHIDEEGRLLTLCPVIVMGIGESAVSTANSEGPNGEPCGIIGFNKLKIPVDVSAPASDGIVNPDPDEAESKPHFMIAFTSERALDVLQSCIDDLRGTFNE